ncbi:MAG TPA: hypothetical protein PLJ60_14160 [Chryseolinea sp.]|jgi:hypothetical protein|nr:hypothetical protein [Chryseolinea sp.]
MKTITEKVSRSGNQVAFLCGALLNVIIAIAQDGVSERDWYLLFRALIGGIVWILCNQLYQWIKFRWVKM